ncbi:unnamed protein product [Bursaphelenchus okinawaensis]|uniref:Uncharacterized protein n=1 Tax=Bursaphelenchus okinawaensis TaxID=465554 RepID=A0A811L0Y9_9BILA|nr:unnamed protein product [Bursaphelenchus okinawaensis]CAG9114151.1 unnamed protein product [Bursaphelenchus okinawaensis]
MFKVQMKTNGAILESEVSHNWALSKYFTVPRVTESFVQHIVPKVNLTLVDMFGQGFLQLCIVLCQRIQRKQCRATRSEWPFPPRAPQIIWPSERKR